jgi:hypothetical protein
VAKTKKEKVTNSLIGFIAGLLVWGGYIVYQEVGFVEHQSEQEECQQTHQ